MLGFARRVAISSGIIVLLAAPAAVAQEPGQTLPIKGLTNTDAITAFGGAMMVCLRTRTGNQTVNDLAPGDRADFQPAAAADRKWAGKVADATPVWVSTKLGYLLNISEPSPERCEVHAIQLPVERTFQAVLFAMGKAMPEFKPVALRPAYNPIAYQIEQVEHGTRYVFHMEGAEPGAPGHALRFSLLYGVVVRQPATDKPVFPLSP
jgi:hypothetical protein